jgi:hypothetical protein
MNYPEEWNELPRRERRKKLRAWRREQTEKSGLVKKISNWGLVIVVIVLVVVGFTQLNKKTPEQIPFEQEVTAVSLDGKVVEFPIEGTTHLPMGTTVNYQTNPPTSGDHYANPVSWGIYDEEVIDEAVIHSLEHGGIWISYQDLSKEEKAILTEIGQQNPQSTVISPRASNESKLVVVSWGKMMSLDTIDQDLTQKYIDTYKNQSPEKLAR